MTSTLTEQPSLDPVIQTAEIIPFPARQITQPATLRPHERLAIALETLNLALAEQRAAIATWRAALTELKASATGLGESLQKYRTSLGTLSEGISELQTHTRALQVWADRPLTTQS